MGKQTLTVDEILAKCRVQEAEFDLGGIGIIKVRGLTKDTQQQARNDATRNELFDNNLFELAVVKAGVVEPKLSDEDITKIKNIIPASLFDSIIYKISDLSGVEDTTQIKKS